MEATDDSWHVVPQGDAGGDENSAGLAAGGGMVITDNLDTPAEPM